MRTNEVQARPAKIRFKDGKKNQFVHTSNGASMAIRRTIAAFRVTNLERKDNIKANPILGVRNLDYSIVMLF